MKIRNRNEMARKILIRPPEKKALQRREVKKKQMKKMVKTGRGNSHKEAQQKRQAIGKQLKTDENTLEGTSCTTHF